MKTFFNRIKWFFSFKKRKQIKEFVKKSNEVFERTVVEQYNDIFPKCPLDFTAPTEILEVKSNDYFVKAEGSI